MLDIGGQKLVLALFVGDKASEAQIPMLETSRRLIKSLPPASAAAPWLMLSAMLLR